MDSAPPPAGHRSRTSKLADFAPLMFVLPPLFWSGNLVMARGLHEVFPPVGLAFWRWTAALAILLAVGGRMAWLQRRSILSHWRLLVVYGLLGVAGYNTLLYVGLQTTTAINAAVLNAGLPLIIPLFTWLLAGERLTARQAVGLALSLSGVLWILCRGDPSALAALSFRAGDGWILLAVLSWAIYSALLRYRPADLSPLVFMLTMVGVGVAALCPFYTWELMASGRSMPLSGQSLAVVLYLALFASILAWICWNRSVVLIGATRTGLAFHLIPLFSGAMAIALLGEALYGYHLVGGLCILVGIVLTTVVRRTAAA